MASFSKHVKHCKQNPNRTQGKNGFTNNPSYKFSDETRKKMALSASGRKHSEDTKRKLSEKRIEFLLKNPDKIPYKINHYSKGPSYPEKYWKEVFRNENLSLIEQYRIGLYSLDFCIEAEKIDIEIDGEQHYVDRRIVESDKIRNDALISLGWKIVRIRWARFLRLGESDRREFVKNLINRLRTSKDLNDLTYL